MSFSDITDVRVDGAMLGRFVGKMVRVTVKIINIGDDFMIARTPDSTEIRIRPHPSADPISQTLVEFVGQVEDANTIHGHKWYELKLKSDEDKYMQQWKQTLTLMHNAKYRDAFM